MTMINPSAAVPGAVTDVEEGSLPSPFSGSDLLPQHGLTLATTGMAGVYLVAAELSDQGFSPLTYMQVP